MAAPLPEPVTRPARAPSAGSPSRPAPATPACRGPPPAVTERGLRRPAPPPAVASALGAGAAWPTDVELVAGAAATVAAVPAASPAIAVEARVGEPPPAGRACEAPEEPAERVTVAAGSVARAIDVAAADGSTPWAADRFTVARADAFRRAASRSAGVAARAGAATAVAAAAIDSARAAVVAAGVAADCRARFVGRSCAGDSAAGRTASDSASGVRAVSFSRSVTSRGRQRAATGPAAARSRACVAAGVTAGVAPASAVAAAMVLMSVVSAVAAAWAGVVSARRSGVARGSEGAGGSSERDRSNLSSDACGGCSISGGASRRSATLRSGGRSRNTGSFAAAAGREMERGRSCVGFSVEADRGTWSRKSAARLEFLAARASGSSGRFEASSSRETDSPPKMSMCSAMLAAAARASRHR